MKQSVVRTSSAWLASLVALLVALGTQVVLEAITPASVAELQALVSGGPSPTYVAGHESQWAIESCIRFLSFCLGGVIAIRLAALSASLLAMLVGAAVLGTVFQQFPSRLVPLSLAPWSLAAPAGIIFGAWAAHAKRRAA